MSEEKIILDYGCGLGGNYKFLYKRGKYIGVDILPENIAYAQKRYGKELFQVVDGEKIPFSDGYFDEVHAYDVFEHVEKLEAVLNEVVRVLKPGGKIFVTVPAEISEKKLLAAKPDYFTEVGHVRIVDPAQLQKMMKERKIKQIAQRKVRGMEAVVYWVLFNLQKNKKYVAYQTGSPEFNKFLVAFIWLFDSRLFFTPLKYFFVIYVFTLPVGWLLSQFFPKSNYIIFEKCN